MILKWTFKNFTFQNFYYQFLIFELLVFVYSVFDYFNTIKFVKDESKSVDSEPEDGEVFGAAEASTSSSKSPSQGRKRILQSVSSTDDEAEAEAVPRKKERNDEKENLEAEVETKIEEPPAVEKMKSDIKESEKGTEAKGDELSTAEDEDLESSESSSSYESSSTTTSSSDLDEDEEEEETSEIQDEGVEEEQQQEQRPREELSQEKSMDDEMMSNHLDDVIKTVASPSKRPPEVTPVSIPERGGNSRKTVGFQPYQSPSVAFEENFKPIEEPPGPPMIVKGRYDPLQYDHSYFKAVPRQKFLRRLGAEDDEVLEKFLTDGLNKEDFAYMKQAFIRLMSKDEPPPYLHGIRWSTTEANPVKKVIEDEPEPHKSGSARTEPFYRPAHKDRVKFISRQRQIERTEAQSLQDVASAKQAAQLSREARHMQRRLIASMPDVESDLLKFNQLKFRKKLIKFGRSSIHNWGLFALESIAENEMVVEYVGQMIRLTVAEKREKRMLLFIEVSVNFKKFKNGDERDI